MIMLYIETIHCNFSRNLDSSDHHLNYLSIILARNIKNLRVDHDHVQSICMLHVLIETFETIKLFDFVSHEMISKL